MPLASCQIPLLLPRIVGGIHIGNAPRPHAVHLDDHFLLREREMARADMHHEAWQAGRYGALAAPGATRPSSRG
jgi:hypothetical protein